MRTPVKAIRAKCLDCCCGNTAEVKRCDIETCSLYPYRMGRRPAKVQLPISNELETKTHS